MYNQNVYQISLLCILSWIESEKVIPFLNNRIKHLFEFYLLLSLYCLIKMVCLLAIVQEE